MYYCQVDEINHNGLRKQLRKLKEIRWLHCIHKMPLEKVIVHKLNFYFLRLQMSLHDLKKGSSLINFVIAAVLTLILNSLLKYVRITNNQQARCLLLNNGSLVILSSFVN